jgi:hypothetical protein
MKGDTADPIECSRALKFNYQGYHECVLVEAPTPAPEAVTTGTDTDGMVLPFSGYGHVGGLDNAEWLSVGEEGRPEWMKPLRCQGDDCHECTPGGEFEACPYPIVDAEWPRWKLNKTNISVTDPQWDNYRLKLHVVCKSSTTEGFMAIKSSSHTGLTVTNNGEPINNETQPGTAYYTFHFQTEEGKTHEIEIKWMPNGMEDAQLFIGGFALKVKSNFVSCSEKQYCLHDIVSNSSASSTAEAYDLAGSNTKQLECLKLDPDNITGDACQRWRNCLANISILPTAMTELTSIMTAALEPVQETPLSPEPVQSLIQETSLEHVAESHNNCIDPRNENPEEWACDCRSDWFEGPLSACPDASSVSDTGSACLRKHWCDAYSTRLCQGWKAAFCNTSSSASSSLLERFERRSSPQEQDRSLDESLTGKEMC